MALELPGKGLPDGPKKHLQLACDFRRALP
jgi:hypothetical protein